MVASSYGADGSRLGSDAAAATGTGAGTGAGAEEVLDPLGLTDFLMKLPGVSQYNIRKLLARLRCIADLAAMTLEELAGVMGPASAKKLHAFLHQQIGWTAPGDGAR